jgi:osmotically-inducible protein OsmY
MKANLIQLMSLVLLGCTQSDAAPAGSEAASGALIRVGAAAQQEVGSTDQAIVDRVRHAIRTDKEIGPDAAAIEVAARDGVVTLRGLASSDAVKNHATDVAQTVANTVRVDNQLAVDPAESNVDRVVSDHVRQAFLDDKDIGTDATVIRIATRDGVVTLRGFVRTEAVKRRMLVVSKAVGSVVRVENQLVVDPESAGTGESVENPIDRLISERVRQAILGERALALELRTVLVQTQEGVVRLTGTVSSEAVKSRMGVVANAVGSVTRVENQLEVKAR